MLSLIVILLCSITVASSRYGDPVNPIDATNFLGSGFDAYTGLYGLAPIFTFTYSDNQTWTSPYSKIEYNVPDQMVVHKNERVYELVNQGSYSSYVEFLDMFVEWFTFDIGIEAGYIGGGLQYYKQLGYVHDSLEEQYASVAHGDHYWSYYVATMYPEYTMNVTPIFQKSLNMFPQTIKTDQDREKAYQFVKTFGTHYCYRAVFGAKVDFDVSMTEKLINSYSKEWTIEQVGFTFHYYLFNISAGGFENRTDITIDKTFLQNTNSQVFFYGGDPTLANLGNITAWTKTLDSNTYPMNTTLIGLWNFVEDPIKQETMKTFITGYLNGQTKSNKNNKRNKEIKRKSKDSGLDLPKVTLQDLTCLGAGLDTTTMQSCLGSIYIPTTSNTFVQLLPESQFVEFDVVMTESFNIDAWTKYQVDDSGFLGTGFGATTTKVYEFYKQHYSEKKSLSFISLQLAYYKATSPILPMPVVNPLFTKYVNSLPDFNSSNSKSVEMYFEFFKTWGYAVIDSITLGGSFETKLWYDTYLNDIYSGSEISEYSHWSLMGVIGDGHGTISKNYNVNKIFAASLEIEYVYVGGDTNMTQSYYKDWASTVKGNMGIIKYHLQPITKFVMDKKKIAAIDSAYMYYAQQSMKNLTDYIDSLINFSDV